MQRLVAGNTGKLERLALCCLERRNNAWKIEASVFSSGDKKEFVEGKGVLKVNTGEWMILCGETEGR